MEKVTIASENGRAFQGYLAAPTGQSAAAPALILLQEVYGANRFMRAIASHWATCGFMALVPELYWRLGDIELDPETPGHREQALATRNDMDIDTAVQDIQTAVRYLRSRDDCSGKVATQGYCLGGLLSYLMATRGDADCNVSYYGVGIEDYFDEAGKITTPLLLHMGESDPWTPEAVRTATKAALDPTGQATIHAYPNTDHAFAREGASSEVPAMKELANGRSLAFLQANLCRA